MPQLGDGAAKKVAGAESSGFLIEDGLYKVRLIDVEEKPQTGNQQAPQWVWKLQFPEDAPQYANRQIWRFTSLAEKAAPFMKECFEAFGGHPAQNTDELIGRFCLVEIVVALKHNHAHSKDFENKIHKMYPISGAEATASASNGKASAATDDLKPLF